MEKLNIHFLDVGHGDCTIIDFPSGHLTIVDINNCKTLDKETEDEIKHRYRPPTLGLAAAAALRGSFLPASYSTLGTLANPPEQNPFLATNPYSRSALGTLSSLLAEKTEAERKLEEARGKLTNPVDYLKAHFPLRPIFRYIQTHPDMDHMAGLHRLTEENIQIVNFWDTHHCVQKDEDALRSGQVNKNIKDWHTYQHLRAGNAGPTVLRLTSGNTGNYWSQDKISVWTPFNHEHCDNPDADPNALSYVLLIQVGKCNILLGGDATIEMWQEMYDKWEGKFPKIHLLKASHHGRKSGYHREAVKAMDPTVTILSVGELKAKDDAEASYENYSSKGCHSTVDHGNIRATCWEDGDVWLYEDDNPNAFLMTGTQ